MWGFSILRLPGIFVSDNNTVLNRMLKSFFLSCMLLSFTALFAVEGVRCGIIGVVNDKQTGKAIEYATVGIEELGTGTLTGIDGKFRLEGIPAGKWEITVQYLGYASLHLPLEFGRDTTLSLMIEKQTLKLNEVQVSAEYNSSGTSMKVRKTALEHIQPSSLSDIFQLLPGYLAADGNMSEVSQVTSRQAGSDKNTALGMALVNDGAPMSNNAGLEAIYGADKLIKERSTINSGTDLRLISTDHLEEVEIIPGISSVKYGDLSSGVVLMKPKSGASPLELRIKADPCNKLAYAGKGFNLGAHRGTLHLGGDITQAKPDVREQLQKYTRFTAQMIYENQKSTRIGDFHYRWRTTYTGTIDKEQKDPDLTPETDTYSSAYNRISMGLNTDWKTGKDWLDRVELTVSGDYASDVLTRDKTVSLKGPFPLPVSGQEGEYEGVYLPSEYVSHYKIENKPFNFYGQLSATSIFSIGGTDHKVLVGLENRTDKNLGRGALYDPLLPPFPDNNASSRPRSLRSVRAMVNNAFFAEDNIRYQYLSHQWGLSLGVRLTNLANLPSRYALHGRWFAEPRISLSYTYSGMRVGSAASSLTLRAGYGEQVKLPTLDMLYPDQVWFDEIAANYYSQTPENRFLWVNTQVRSRENPALGVNRNRKYEVGADWQVGKFKMNLTLFNELSNSGFEAYANYFSFQYRKYENPAVLPAGKPEIGDFTPRPDTLLKNYTTMVNASHLRKRGIEYRIGVPKIESLRTEIELNGAYYKTSYDVSLPMQYRPQSAINGKQYLYAGIYDWNSDSRVQSRLNTNLWIYTHIPRFKLLFSAMLQTVWFTSSQSRRFDGVPVAYIAPDGIIRPFTEAEQNDSRYAPLLLKHSENYFKERREPVSMSLNLKVTKEIGERLRLSFMVNRLWDYNPKYKTNTATENRKWVVPAFGAELGIKI